MLDSTPEGAIVVSVVVRGGAAALAGIQEGDMILKVDDHAVVPGVSESRSACRPCTDALQRRRRRRRRRTKVI